MGAVGELYRDLWHWIPNRYRDCGETPSSNCQEPFSEIRLCNAKVCPSKIKMLLHFGVPYL